MNVDLIELYKVIIPLGRNEKFYPNWIPGFPQTDLRFYLLRVGTDSGLDGFAAVPAMNTERDSLGPCLGLYLMGVDPLDLSLINRRIQEFSYIGLRNGWIDAAFWDIAGKAQGAPVWKLLGGSGGAVYPYWSTGDNYGHDPSQAARAARDAATQGYRGIKLRVKSSNLKQMLDFIAAARKEIGGKLGIMVDANQGWPVSIIEPTPIWTLEFAMEFARRLEELNIFWLEEPLNRGNIRGLARLRASTETRIAGGELCGSWVEFQEMLELGSLDYYQPDAVLAEGSYIGGISAVYHLIQEIQKRNSKSESSRIIQYCPHTWTNGIGFYVNLHLYGLIPEEKRQWIEFPMEGGWNPSLWARMLKNMPRPDPNLDGRIKIPDTPGLGIEVDWKAIKRYGKRLYRGTQTKVGVNLILDKGLKTALELKRNKEKSAAAAAQSFRLPQLPY